MIGLLNFRHTPLVTMMMDRECERVEMCELVVTEASSIIERAWSGAAHRCDGKRCEGPAAIIISGRDSDESNCCRRPARAKLDGYTTARDINNGGVALHLEGRLSHVAKEPL